VRDAGLASKNGCTVVMLEMPGLVLGHVTVAKRQEMKGKREGGGRGGGLRGRSGWGSHWRVGTMPFVLAPGALSSSSISIIEREGEMSKEQVNR
jgi:hypothetical protein